MTETKTEDPFETLLALIDKLTVRLAYLEYADVMTELLDPLLHERIREQYAMKLNRKVPGLF